LDDINCPAFEIKRSHEKVYISRLLKIASEQERQSNKETASVQVRRLWRRPGVGVVKGGKPPIFPFLKG
jgi:hypothetical protein